MEDARRTNLNEADTMVRIIKIFEDVLGYNSMTEITREQAIKDKYVDLAIKINGGIAYLIEVKSADTKLRDKHIEQAEMYASRGNIQWVLLTNGIEWILYHLTFDEGIQYDRVWECSIVEDIDSAAELIGILDRKSVASGSLERHWNLTVAVSPESIGKVLFSEDVINVIRRELKRSIGVRIDEEVLISAIHSLFSIESRERIGPPRIRRKRKTRVKKSDNDTSNTTVEEIEITESVIDDAEQYPND